MPLTTTNLMAIDPDTPLSELTYTIAQYKNTTGTSLLHRVLTPGVTQEIQQGDSFTQAEVDNGIIEFHSAVRSATDAILRNDSIDISLSDGNSTVTAEFSIQSEVYNYAVRPVGSDKSWDIDEDTSQIITSADFGFTDADGDSFHSVSITGINNGVLSLAGNGSSIGGGSTTRQNIDTNGPMIFTPAGDFNGLATVTFRVADTSTGPYNEDDQDRTLTFNVAPVIDRPTGTDKLFNIDEDTNQHLESRILDFLDIDLDNFVSIEIKEIRDQSTNVPIGKLMLNNTEVVAGDTIDIADIIASDSLLFAPPQNFHGSVVIDFLVIDDNSSGRQ